MTKIFVIEKKKSYAIITGDIVGSSKLKPAQRKNLIGILKSTSKEIRIVYKKIIPFDVDIFRGDSWQLLVTEPKSALRIALLFRASLKSKMGIRVFDSKIFIGVSTIDSLPGQRVSLGNGEAFVLSGRGLENLKKHKMGIDYPSFEKNDYLGLIVRLIDVLATGWTVKQSASVNGALKGLTQKEIAESLNLKQQTVYGHLIGSHFTEIEHVLNVLENNSFE